MTPTARELYEAYNAGGDPATRNRSWDGRPCPAWDDLPPNVRAKWQAVADCVAARAHGPPGPVVQFDAGGMP